MQIIGDATQFYFPRKLRLRGKRTTKISLLLVKMSALPGDVTSLATECNALRSVARLACGHSWYAVTMRIERCSSVRILHNFIMIVLLVMRLNIKIVYA